MQQAEQGLAAVVEVGGAGDVLAEEVDDLRPARQGFVDGGVAAALVGADGDQVAVAVVGRDQALEAAPENPRIWLLSGMSAIFRPKVFGGGLEKAESEIRRAIELFETDAPAPPAPAWGRGEAWLWLGQVLQRQGRVDEARAAYMKALEYQPGNPWIQETLLPALDGGH